MELGPKRKLLVKLVKQSPGRYSQAALAKKVGLTRERVRQIVEAESLYPFLKNTRKKQRYCARCGALLPPGYRGKYCPKCRVELAREKIVKLQCDWCGKTFTMSRRAYERKLKAGQRHFFCSKACRLAWFSDRLKQGMAVAFPSSDDED